MMKISHTLGPYVNKDSKILILGSFPSVKSRETMFYYGHPQNRFWKVLATIFNEEIPTTIKDKKSLLKAHKIALYDVIEECDISGSADSSIKDVIPANLLKIIKNTKINQIYINGSTAYKYYQKYQLSLIGIQTIKLPSTSPANAIKKLDDLVLEWKIIKE